LGSGIQKFDNFAIFNSGLEQRMEENRIPKRVLYMNLETIRPRGRPRNRWLDEVREDGRMVGGEKWQEKVYDREEWRRLLRTASNHRILFMPMDWIATVMQLINRYRVVKITWYGDVLLKQQAVIEFLVAENESVTNIHQQLKNVYGVRVVDKSTVSH
jgi:acetolactate synthase regulatory subunit